MRPFVLLLSVVGAAILAAGCAGTPTAPLPTDSARHRAAFRAEPEPSFVRVAAVPLDGRRVVFSGLDEPYPALNPAALIEGLALMDDRGRFWWAAPGGEDGVIPADVAAVLSEWQSEFHGCGDEGASHADPMDAERAMPPEEMIRLARRLDWRRVRVERRGQAMSTAQHDPAALAEFVLSQLTSGVEVSVSALGSSANDVFHCPAVLAPISLRLSFSGSSGRAGVPGQSGEPGRDGDEGHRGRNGRDGTDGGLLAAVPCAGTDGRDGESGGDGRRGRQGGHGSDGGNGSRGEDARPVEVTVSVFREAAGSPIGERILRIDARQAGITRTHVVPESAKVRVIARGGAGGDGGNGGSGGQGGAGGSGGAGGNGGDGGDGGTATIGGRTNHRDPAQRNVPPQIVRAGGGRGGNGGRGGDGGDGIDGGDGGHGGQGADGGNGGVVTVRVSEGTLTTMVRRLLDVDVSGGQPGDAGRGGQGGEAGRGGEAGKGGNWGSGGSGSPSGWSGTYGTHGKEGRAGRRGASGSFGTPGLHRGTPGSVSWPD